MQVQQTLRTKLEKEFKPLRLEITDDSHLHTGHLGEHPEGESHFSIEIVSAYFTDRNRAERQRLVHKVLAEELSGRVHALSLRLLSPDEDK